MNEEELLAREQMRREKKRFEIKQSKIGRLKKKKYRKVRKDRHISKKTKEAIQKGEQLKL